MPARSTLRRLTAALVLTASVPLALVTAPPASAVVGPGAPTLEWARQFGATIGTRSENVTVAASKGNVHAIAGSTDGTLPGQSNAGSQDAFIRRYDDGGNVVWTRQFGTSGDEFVSGLGVDSAGNVVVVGHTTGAFAGFTSLGSTDVFVRKYDPVGDVVWTRQFGTSAQDTGGKVALDSADNIALIGSTRGSLAGFMLSGSSDAFLKRFAADGTELVSAQFGSTADDSGQGIAIDGNGALYVCGHASASLFGRPPLGSGDAYVVKFDQSAAMQWTAQFGTANFESCTDLAVDPAGNSYAVVVGFGSQIHRLSPVGAVGDVIGFGARINAIAADSTGVAIVGFSGAATLSGQTNAGENDAYVRRYNLALAEQWTDLFGTRQSEDAVGVALTPTSVFVVGRTNGVLPGETPGGSSDAFARKYSVGGAEQWTDQFTSFGPSDNFGRGVHVDSTRIYSAGRTNGPLAGNVYEGDADAFIASHDLAGNLLWLRQFGSTGFDEAAGVAGDGSGNAIVAGFTVGALPGQTAGSAADGFLKKFDLAGNEIWTRQFAFPGASQTRIEAIETNASGEIFVSGYAVFGGTSPGIDIIAAKFDANGATVWTHRITASDLNEAKAIALEPDGGVVICGFTNSALAGQAKVGNADAFVARLDAAGSLSWLRQFGASSGQVSQCRDVSVASDGTVYVAGQTTGAFPGHSAAGGTFDIFAAKLSGGGSLEWTRQFGSSLSDRGVAAIADADNNVTIVGSLGDTATNDTVFRRFDSSGAVLGNLVDATPNVDPTFAAAANAHGVIAITGSASTPFAGQTQTGRSDATVKKYLPPNSAPTVSVDTAVVAANEGSTAANTGTWADANGDDVSLTSSLGIVTKHANGTWSWSATANEGPSSSSVVITADDGRGGSSSTAFQLDVANLPPVLGAATGPTSAAAVGTPVTISAPVSDPGALDVLSCRFIWGDGTLDTTVNGSCSATHTYSAAGIYPVDIVASDDDGGSASTSFENVIAYDPSAGFVTVGGWISSPIGALVANPSLTGRANLSLVARYRRDAAVPTGQSEFHFQAGRLRFSSDGFDALVIAGQRARVSGTGSVNGESGYRFVVTVVDASSGDRLRLKVWKLASATGPEVLVYDNVPGASDDFSAANAQPLSGGAITLHA